MPARLVSRRKATPFRRQRLDGGAPWDSRVIVLFPPRMVRYKGTSATIFFQFANDLSGLARHASHLRRSGGTAAEGTRRLANPRLPLLELVLRRPPKLPFLGGVRTWTVVSAHDLVVKQDFEESKLKGASILQTSRSAEPWWRRASHVALIAELPMKLILRTQPPTGPAVLAPPTSAVCARA